MPLTAVRFKWQGLLRALIRWPKPLRRAEGQRFGQSVLFQYSSQWLG
jgi:hypothetical protein